MSGVNKVIIIGNVVRDPEPKSTGDGVTICNITVATSEKWKDKGGNQQEKSEFHRISMFGKLAEIGNQYLKKGSLAYFEGKLQTRKWTDKDGNEKQTTEIVADQMRMLSSRQDEPLAEPRRSNPAPPGGRTTGKFDDLECDVPFAPVNWRLP